MSETLFITAVAPGFVTLTSAPAASPVLDDIYFAMSSGGAVDVVRRGSVITLPDSLLVQRLSALRKLQRRLGFRIEPDPLSESLIRGYLREVVSIEDARADTQAALPREEVERRLKEVGFRRNLTREQTRDVGRLALLLNGANFSVPGAGKTTSLLAVHALMQQEYSPLHLLIVAPRNAFLSWDEEILACLGSESEMVRLTGGKTRIAALLRDDPQFVGVTYQQLPIVLKEVEAYVRRNRVHLVLDESHRAKGGSAGIQGSAVLALAPMAARRDILSGTPMPQGITDLTPQFEFLWPGHGLCSPLNAAIDEEVQQANQLLSPFFVRTKKSELGLVPPIQHTRVIELGEQQRELYELMRSEAARLARGLDTTDRSKMRALGRQVMRLIQAASNPNLLLASVEQGNGALGYDRDLIYLLRATLRNEQPAKLVALDEMVCAILSDPQAKVVIWSTFVLNIEYLVKQYAAYNAVAIHGGVPTGDEEDSAYREARIKRFNSDPICRVLVANPAACGEGISLHRACHNAIYLDRSYNAAHFLQSVDRIHRLGLSADVQTNVFLLTSADTIDESVDARLAQKIAAMGHLLDDDQLKALAYDPEDVLEDVPSGLSSDDVDSILEHLQGSRNGE